MAVTLINTTSRNIWIHQPLLAAKIYEGKLHPWQYKSILHREGNTIKVVFQTIVPPEVEGDLQTNQVEAKVNEEPSEGESTPPLPSFGPHPYTSKEYNFEDEVKKNCHLNSIFGMPYFYQGAKKKNHLLNLIYDHKKYFHFMMKI